MVKLPGSLPMVSSLLDFHVQQVAPPEEASMQKHISAMAICLGILIGAVYLTSCDSNPTKEGEDTESTGGDNTPHNSSDDGNADSTVADSTSTGDNTPGDGGWVGDTSGTVVVGDNGQLITDEDGHEFLCIETRCDGRILECGDCRDNDGDGRTDWRDPECLGPCDNTEGPALISDVGGVTGSTCHVDCYFDFGNGMGSGSDDCWWSHECDPLEPESPVCDYRESLVGNPQFCPDEQSDRCTDICLPFTPNGCDCFGCCTFPELAGAGENGEDGYVWIGAKDPSNRGMCTFADILDESKCPRCTPVPNCLNACGHCEICIGKPELPDDCYPEDSDDTDTEKDPPDEQCPPGIETCSFDDLVPCEEGYYCISGCCQPLINVE